MRKERGIFEKEPGSGIWWVRYKIDGVERREKVGRRGDAMRLYQLRRADALRGVKLPPNIRHKGIRFRVIGEEAINWVHRSRPERREELPDQDEHHFEVLRRSDLADEIKPSEIDAWLSAHAWSPATKNRYKNVFGKTYKKTLVYRLEEKDALRKVKKIGNAQLFQPALDQRQYRSRLVRDLLDLFGGLPRLLVSSLLENGALTLRDLNALQSAARSDKSGHARGGKRA